jgi:hypothetical protein
VLEVVSNGLHRHLVLHRTQHTEYSTQNTAHSTERNVRGSSKAQVPEWGQSPACDHKEQETASATHKPFGSSVLLLSAQSAQQALAAARHQRVLSSPAGPTTARHSTTNTALAGQANTLVNLITLVNLTHACICQQTSSLLIAPQLETTTTQLNSPKPLNT